MNNNKTLFIYGWVLSLIALTEIVLLVIGVVRNDFAMVTNPDKLVETVTNAIIIAVLILDVLSIVVDGYLGLRGVWEAQNPTSGKFHIILANIVAVINAILTVLVAIALFNSKDLLEDIITCVVSLVNTVFMFFYAKVAKAVREGK